MVPHTLFARRICDGTGAPPFPGMVTVADGVIQEVRRLAENAAELRAVAPDAPVLAPGFIDSHGHSDLSIFAMPEAEGKAAQGITTEIAGNCGLSAFPVTECNRDHLEELYHVYRTPLDWHDFASYRAALARRNARLDVIPLVGHNTLRAAVAGYETRKLSQVQLNAMCELLAAELEAGSPGLSAGLLYVPGCFADHAELVALLKVTARYDRVFTIHLRSEGDRLEEALAETLAAAREAKLTKLHLSHLKTAHARNFAKIGRLLEALRTPGLRVTGDVYPYTAAMTQCGVILPSPYDDMSDTALTRHLADEKNFRTALTALRAERAPDYWRCVMIVNAAPEFRDCVGIMLSEAAERRKMPPEELFLRIVQRDAATAAGAFHTLSYDNMVTLALRPEVVPGSDESARSRTREFGSSHPRGFGAMPEYFRLLREHGVPLEEIIARMTGRPAAIFGLRDRGRIAPGLKADLMWLEPERFRANATYREPHRLAEGVARAQ